MTKSKGKIAKRQYWTPEQEAQLRVLYPEHSCQYVANLMGRLPGSVYAAANRLGLKKSAAFLASDKSGRVQRGKQHPRMVASQFKPGLQPWNKGTHYVAGGRSAETRFKKGHMAGAAQHNYVPIGSLRITKDGYLERKVTDDQSLVPARRWTALHRLVWEQAFGPIPAGHMVVFKPGMKTVVEAEVTKDRLECISRAENARRNSYWQKDHDLAKLFQLKGAITRQVNRIKEAQRA